MRLRRRPDHVEVLANRMTAGDLIQRWTGRHCWCSGEPWCWYVWDPDLGDYRHIFPWESPVLPGLDGLSSN